MSIKGRYKFNEEDHIHELDGKPLTGTSSVLSIVAKPLTYWASGMAVSKLGWTNPKFTTTPARETAAAKVKTIIETQTLTDYIKLLDEAYHAHAKSLKTSAGKGRDLHSELERYVKECIKNDKVLGPSKEADLSNPIEAFAHWSLNNVEKFLWSEMHTYSETEWLGGITDAGAKMKDGSIAIIDFKSSKDAYNSQFIQIGGYSIQIKENGGYTREGDKIIEPTEATKFIIIPFGSPEFKVVEKVDIPAYEKGFRSALNLYRLENNDNNS